MDDMAPAQETAPATEERDWVPASEWLGAGAVEPVIAVAGVPVSTGSEVPSEEWRTPAALREMLARFSTFDGERDVDLEAVPVRDLGDWDVADLALEEAHAEIARRAAELPAAKLYAFLGGDNSITRPLLRGFAGDDLDKAGLLKLDAHHDVRHTDEGPLVGTIVRGLIEDGLPPGRVVELGIHTFANSRYHREYCEQHGVRSITMGRVDEWGIESAIAWGLDLLSEECDWVYVNFAFDVLDRSYAPACLGARPGGMTLRQLAAAAYACGRSHLVRAADFVEVDVTRDVNDETMMSLATVFLSFMSGFASRIGGPRA